MYRKFNDGTYEILVKDLINDAFYSTLSKRGKIAKIRQYAEVVVRRILDINPNNHFTLGSEKTKKKLKEKNSQLLENSVNNINALGNKCTHTQFTEDVSEDEVKVAMESLFNLYAFLLIEYFEKFEFGSNSVIMHRFSILPPIIRFLTLEELYSKNPDNIFVIDKLVLAMLKAFNRAFALNWVEERKEHLKRTSMIISESSKGEIAKNIKINVENMVIVPNMYDVCKSKINMIAEYVQINGKLYNDFESALEYYQKIGEIEGKTLEILEFNSIMHFLYLGRKTNKEIDN